MAMPISGYLVCRAFLYIWGFGCLVNLVNLAPKSGLMYAIPLVRDQKPSQLFWDKYAHFSPCKLCSKDSFQRGITVTDSGPFRNQCQGLTVMVRSEKGCPGCWDQTNTNLKGCKGLLKFGTKRDALPGQVRTEKAPSG